MDEYVAKTISEGDWSELTEVGWQIMASMMKSMTPETMTSMSEQLGMKMTPEQAKQAQQAMASLSPEQIDRLVSHLSRSQKQSD